MTAPKGNEFYRCVEKPTGRPKKYTSDTLWDKAFDYFKWVVDNPLWEQKAFGNGTIADLPKMRAMTELAFCLFAGITQETFRKYKSGAEPYQDFIGVSNQIAEIIYQQKFEGAAAEFLNPNIIARDLGLKERTEAEVSGKGGAAIQLESKSNIDTSKLSTEVLVALYDSIKRPTTNSEG